MLVARDVIREIAEGLYFYVDGISFRCEKHPPFFRIAHAVIRYTKIDKNGNCRYCFVLYF